MTGPLLALATRILLAAALALSACTGAPAPAPEPEPSNDPRFAPERVRVTLEPFASGLRSPLGIVHAGDERLFAIEQGGRIVAVDAGEVADEPVLDISERVSGGYEQGLLGAAFHPRDPARLFVNYTDRDGDTVIAEYAIREGETARGGGRVLLRIDQPFPNHNGGQIAFEPDGTLWIGTGDGGSGGDPLEAAQDLGSLLGKILRIDVDGERPYAVPRDNPFVDTEGARPEIWAYGLRNPWRFSFDAPAGVVWVADVGQDRFEEVNRAPIARGGVDYGWDDLEGYECFEPADGCERDGSHEPLTTYRINERSRCAVVGGYAYRGPQEALRGAYLFADNCSGEIWAVRADGKARQDRSLLLDSERAISSFGLDASGELYVTDIAGGAVLRVVAHEG